MLENNKIKIINDFIEKNKNKLKEHLNKCEIITRKDLEIINDKALKEEIKNLINDYKIDIDKLAFDIECIIFDDELPFADIEALDYD